MPQKHKYQSLLILIFLIFVPISLSAATYEGVRTEYDDLKEIYQTGIPQKLREIFDSYSQLDPNDPKNKEKLSEASEYLPLFREKFIVGDLIRFDDGRHCNAPSYVISIFISPKKMEGLTITIYKTSESNYKICYITSYHMTELRRRRYLYWLKFKNYWI